MGMLMQFVDVLLHLDKHLTELANVCGLWTYLILFLVIFCETGLVVTPFLPGDSLLFVIGALSAGGKLDIWGIGLLLFVAAVLGDTVNYHIGRYFGPKIFSFEKIRFIKKEHLIRTQQFYERHGGKTIIIARFIPIIRTFAPFVAGIGTMHYFRFLAYNLVGGGMWVGAFLAGGYFFGNIPFVAKNFTMVIMVIILISILPGLISYLSARRDKRRQDAAAAAKTEAAK